MIFDPDPGIKKYQKARHSKAVLQTFWAQGLGWTFQTQCNRMQPDATGDTNFAANAAVKICEISESQSVISFDLAEP